MDAAHHSTGNNSRAHTQMAPSPPNFFTRISNNSKLTSNRFVTHNQHVFSNSCTHPKNFVKTEKAVACFTIVTYVKTLNFRCIANRGRLLLRHDIFTEKHKHRLLHESKHSRAKRIAVVPTERDVCLVLQTLGVSRLTTPTTKILYQFHICDCKFTHKSPQIIQYF